MTLKSRGGVSRFNSPTCPISGAEWSFHLTSPHPTQKHTSQAPNPCFLQRVCAQCIILVRSHYLDNKNYRITVSISFRKTTVVSEHPQFVSVQRGYIYIYVYTGTKSFIREAWDQRWADFPNFWIQAKYGT